MSTDQVKDEEAEPFLKSEVTKSGNTDNNNTTDSKEPPSTTTTIMIKSAKPEPTSFWNTVAFITLTVQTAATVLMMRYSRLKPADGTTDDTPQFATTSAVALAEFGKMWVGIIVLSYEIYITKSSHDPFTTFSNQLFGDLKTLLKMAVPACTYSVQNNLLFMALHHLDSSLYQITYQLKIFTAALFAVFMLNRSYSTKQWISFGLLAIGASLANLSMQQTASHKNPANIEEGADSRNQYIGITCVLLATCTSGFAGNIYIYYIMISSYHYPCTR